MWADFVVSSGIVAQVVAAPTPSPGHTDFLSSRSSDRHHAQGPRFKTLEVRGEESHAAALQVRSPYSHPFLCAAGQHIHDRNHGVVALAEDGTVCSEAWKVDFVG